MNNSPLSSNTLNTALATLAGVAAAAVVKLLLDEATEAAAPITASSSQPIQSLVSRRAKLQELATAARDPLYLADMQEVNGDFAFVDAEHI